MRINTKKMMCLLAVMACVVLAAIPLFAEQLNVRFARLTIEQGLSQNSVLSIAQGKRGFLWFGTWDGLNRYDGYTVKTYWNKPDDPTSISSNSVYTLYTDRQGWLWAGTQQGGGLNRYNPAKDEWIRYQHDPNNPQSLSHNDIFAILEDRQGNFWVGTADGLNRCDREFMQCTVYRADPKDLTTLSYSRVFTLFEDQAGTIWIGTARGLNRFDPATQQFTRYLPDPKDPNSISHHEVFAIYEDRQGAFWIGTSDGLNQMDRQTGQFVRYRSNPADPNSLAHKKVSAIFEDEAGTFWVGTAGGGLDIFDPATGQFRHFRNDPLNPKTISGDTITTLFADASGILWVGTEGAGVSRYDRRQQKFAVYSADPQNPQNTLSSDFVRAIYEDQQNLLWIGTYGGGLNRFDRQTQQWKTYKNDPANAQSLSHDVVLTMYEDRSGAFWVGTPKGLQKFDRQTELFDRPIVNQFVRTIFEDRSGMLWIGTLAGLVQYDQAANKFTNYRSKPNDPTTLSSDRVAVIYEDKEGSLWLGTFDGGLNKFDREKKQFTAYRTNPTDLKSLSHDNVTAILEDQQGTFWIGTAGGLNKFDRATGTFRRFTTEQGLPNNTIYGILEDQEGNLWLSTNNGLAKFNPRTEQFRNYNVNDGLQSNEFNGGAAFKSRSGEMFFGGINGFNAFFPDQVKDNPYRPPVMITDLQIFNKSVKPMEKVKNRVVLTNVMTATPQMTLSYRHYVFSFQFAALHYTAPELNQYAYILEGFEKEWNYVGNRRYATYTNLPGGKYTFRVKGSNSDGVWNEEGVHIAITVTPPPWKTWWAYTLYVLSVIGMFVGYILYKQAQYKRERMILDRFVPYEYLGFLGKKSILDVQLGDHVSSDKMGVMFSDIRSFTTISETMTPKENFDFVNAYLRRVAPVIRGHQGFIVKFLGDGMMAVFPNSAEDGVKAAIGKLNQVKEYNVHRLEEGWKPIKVGIGVHTGHMMVGMVGEKARMQGDAFSDNVNLTARLEGLTKYYGVSFLISGDTLKSLANPNDYHIRFLDNVAVKGKEKPIQIYEIYDADAEDLFQKKEQTKADFEQGQKLYFGKDFVGAMTYFKKVLEVIPDDLTTQMYVERAETFIKEGVPEDWAGVQKMDKK